MTDQFENTIELVKIEDTIELVKAEDTLISRFVSILGNYVDDGYWDPFYTTEGAFGEFPLETTIDKLVIENTVERVVFDDTIRAVRRA